MGIFPGPVGLIPKNHFVIRHGAGRTGREHADPTMLKSLAIRNIVLIEALTLEFGGGLGVLTGETGAGECILIEALGLVVGGRGGACLSCFYIL